MVIYALRRYAVDHHGVVTGAAAAGVSAAELAGLVQQGVLEHAAGDVQRLVDVGPTSLTEYAEAVALAGHGAVLAEDAVLALHDLTALARPQRLRVVVPGRPSPPAPAPWVQVLFRDLPDEDVTDIEGISAMTAPAALRACRGQVMTERVLQAVDRAREEELITSATAQELRGELAPSPLPPTPWTQRRIALSELIDRVPSGALADEDDGSWPGDTEPRGWAMVAADGTPLLWSESGFASPEVAGGLPGPIADLLARAAELAERVRQLKERPPAVSPAALIPAGIEAFAANSRLAGLHTCLSLLALIPSASTVKQ